jgi:hypothetical protein
MGQLAEIRLGEAFNEFEVVRQNQVSMAMSAFCAASERDTLASLPSLAASVEFGNAGDIDTNGTGWFIGFSEWTKGPAPALRHVPADVPASGPCVKWFSHPAGHPDGEAKPRSEGRTVSMLVSEASEFRIELSLAGDFPPQERQVLS